MSIKRFYFLLMFFSNYLVLSFEVAQTIRRICIQDDCDQWRTSEEISEDSAAFVFIYLLFFNDFRLKHLFTILWTDIYGLESKIIIGSAVWNGRTLAFSGHLLAQIYGRG